MRWARHDSDHMGLWRLTCTQCVYIVMSFVAHLLHLIRAVIMGDFKHLVIAKFKEGVVVDEILKGMEKLASEVDAVKSFEWGQDLESQEMLRQGFTHAFLMTFSNQGDFTAFMSHPNHVEFSTTFSAAIEKILLLDFPAVLVKAPK